MVFADEVSWQTVAFTFVAGLIQIAMLGVQGYLSWRKSDELKAIKDKAEAAERRADEAEKKATALEVGLTEHKRRGATRYAKTRRVVQRMKERHAKEIEAQAENWKWDRVQKHWANNCNMIVMAKLKEAGISLELPPPPKRTPPAAEPPQPKG